MLRSLQHDRSILYFIGDIIKLLYIRDIWQPDERATNSPMKSMRIPKRMSNNMIASATPKLLLKPLA